MVRGRWPLSRQGSGGVGVVDIFNVVDVVNVVDAVNVVDDVNVVVVDCWNMIFDL